DHVVTSFARKNWPHAKISLPRAHGRSGALPLDAPLYHIYYALYSTIIIQAEPCAAVRLARADYAPCFAAWTSTMPKTPDYFAGKTIIIPGAASGIGRATALIFAREGANVVCADLDEDGARDTASAVNGKGSQALALKADVTTRKEVNDMTKRAIDAF